MTYVSMTIPWYDMTSLEGWNPVLGVRPTGFISSFWVTPSLFVVSIYGYWKPFNIRQGKLSGYRRIEIWLRQKISPPLIKLSYCLTEGNFPRKIFTLIPPSGERWEISSRNKKIFVEFFVTKIPHIEGSGECGDTSYHLKPFILDSRVRKPRLQIYQECPQWSTMG